MDTVWHSATNFILERHNKGDWIADNALKSASGFPPAQLYYYANYYHLRPIYAYTSSESRSSMNSNLPHHFLHTRRHTTTTTVKWLTAIDEDIFPRSAVTFFLPSSAFGSYFAPLLRASLNLCSKKSEMKTFTVTTTTTTTTTDAFCTLTESVPASKIRGHQNHNEKLTQKLQHHHPQRGWLVGCKFDIGR